MPWDGTPLHGWPADPWLPFPPDAGRTNVAREREDAGSMLHLYRRLLDARRASDALRAGDLALLEPKVLSPPGEIDPERTAAELREQLEEALSSKGVIP